MRCLYILVEGETEQEFIDKVLSNYLSAKGINQVIPLLLEKQGGDIRYKRYKSDTLKFLRQNDIIVSSLIDFYALRRDFPLFNDAKGITDKMERVAFLERAISDDINNTRIIPYIQLHEFEGLLFSDMRGFEVVPHIRERNKRELETLVNLNAPELINDGYDTVPSRRLKNLIPEYDKLLYGHYIAEAIGIETIMAKCPRFRAWVEKLIAAMKEDYFD